MELVVLLLLSLIPKIALWAAIYAIVREYYESKLFSLAFSYLLGHLTMILFMLLLSPFQLLGRWGLMACYGLAIAGLILWRTRKFAYLENGRICVKDAHILRTLTAMDKMALLTAAVTFLLLALRALYYYDNTDDATIQGLTKVAFIIQHKSLFVNYETIIVNLFSNEWLGEMNSVYYMAMTRRDISTSFANVEIWAAMLAFFGAAFEAFRPGKKPNWVLVCAVSCSAVVTGLAMTIKTDLFAMALLPFAVACLYRYYRTQSPNHLFASIAALGAAAGAKVSVVPAVGLLTVVLVLYFFFKAKKRHAAPVFLGIVFFALACLRYILNIWHYHNPLQRAINEQVSISYANFAQTLKGLAKAFHESPEIWRTRAPWSASNWALTKGLGWAGYVFGAILGIAGIWFMVKLLKRQSRIGGKMAVCIALPCFAGLLFTMVSTTWYDWSFRYYAPFVFTAVIAAAAWQSAQWEELALPAALKRGVQAVGQCALLLSCLLHTEYSFRYGQAIPVPYERLQNMSHIERKLVYTHFLKADEVMKIPRLVQILDTGGQALLSLNFMSPSFSPLFGKDACVRVDLVYGAEQLLQAGQAAGGQYDFMVIQYDPNLGYEREDALLSESFEKMGYEKHILTGSIFYVK